MKIIISPSKTQKELEENENSNSVKLSDKTQTLFSLLQSYDKSLLSKSLKVNEKLLDKTYDLYQGKYKNQVFPAIECYQGVVFEQLRLNEYTREQQDYLEQNLVILSAMYGSLKPNDLIYSYRLDMRSKLPKINLYQYWEKEILEKFDKEEVIINLASEEFSKLLNKLSSRFLNIYFYQEDKSGKIRIVSTLSKKARGKMLNYLIVNKIINPEMIKAFSEDDYFFNLEISDKHNYRFVKKDK